jgi:hypothetical protein
MTSADPADDARLPERAPLPPLPPRPSLTRAFEALGQKVVFRVAVAIVCLAVHLGALVHSGASRFGAPFDAAPDAPPAFRNPAADGAPEHWNRLIVSRWDAGQYISLGLRGYEYCPARDPSGHVPAASAVCNLAFYPTYGLLGRWLGAVTRLPIDLALFAISLVSAFVFLFLWTGPALTRRLGVIETYLALLLLNAFTTGFSLVSVQTEPLTLALTMGAFVAFTRRSWLLAGFLAGAASAMRITGVATGAACGLALIFDAWSNRPTSRREWAERVAAIALCAWGGAALMGYHLYRFGDALAYVHTHSAAFKHEVSLRNLLQPRPEWLIHAMEQPLHEGVWLVLGVLWFLLGHRAALRRFPPSERAFWYALYWVTVGIASLGQVAIWFQGMNRYLLLALPLFFAMANLLRSRPAALAFWLIVSTWHYWQVDICTYTGGPGDHVLDVCHAPHWMGRI